MKKTSKEFVQHASRTAKREQKLKAEMKNMKGKHGSLGGHEKCMANKLDQCISAGGTYGVSTLILNLILVMKGLLPINHNSLQSTVPRSLNRTYARCCKQNIMSFTSKRIARPLLNQTSLLNIVNLSRPTQFEGSHRNTKEI